MSSSAQLSLATDPAWSSWRSLPALREYIAAFLLFFLFMIGLQYTAGAYTSDCGAHPDEAAHYVSALMIHDYIRSGFPGSPIRYAEQYYLHYPKVAVGMWPPMFHITLAVWMLVFGDSLASALVYLAFLAALLATGVYAVLAPRYGRISLAPAFILLSIPLMRANTSILMADILVAVFAFASLVFLARYLEHGKTHDGVLFGVAVSLACLTKANGVAFVIAAPLAIILSRRFDVLRKRALYYAAAIFVVFALPFQIYSYALIQKNMYAGPGLSLLAEGTVEYLRMLWNVTGPVIGTIALAGVISGVSSRKLSRLSLCSIAAVLAVVGYHATAGFDPRYLLTALPAVVLLVLPGITALTAPFHSRPVVGVIATVLTLVLFAITVKQAPPVQPLGYNRVAQILRTRAADAQVLLVSSDAYGEGAFVAAMAELGRRPAEFALRGTKLLGEMTWYASQYRLLYNTTDELQTMLATVPVHVLVVDEKQPFRFPHQQLIADTIRANSDRWQLVDRITPGPGSAAMRPISIYRQVGVPSRTAQQFELNMKYTMGGSLTIGK
jgi:4-amino-4-deoxy-L-arabinose transferase-like glycosyltransferase